MHKIISSVPNAQVPLIETSQKRIQKKVDTKLCVKLWQWRIFGLFMNKKNCMEAPIFYCITC